MRWIKLTLARRQVGQAIMVDHLQVDRVIMGHLQDSRVDHLQVDRVIMDHPQDSKVDRRQGGQVIMVDHL